MRPNTSAGRQTGCLSNPGDVPGIVVLVGHGRSAGCGCHKLGMVNIFDRPEEMKPTLVDVIDCSWREYTAGRAQYG
jgi:hypothetical protein